MSVYVDNMQASFGRMKMSHLWADSLEELWDMVDKIGVDRKWIQGHPEHSLPKYRKASWVHFDIAKGKREIAIKAGAIKTDKYGPIEHTALLAIASGNPDRASYGEQKLTAIAKCRALGFGGDV